MAKPTRSARRSAAKRAAADKAKAQARRSRDRELLLAEDNDAWHDHDAVRYFARTPTTALLRHPGQAQHKGADVAKMLARTGPDGEPRNPGMGVAWRDRDAAGPLREQVGVTVRDLDYAHRSLDDRSSVQTRRPYAGKTA